MSQRVVTFHYTLKTSAGKELESSHGHDPMTYLEGASQIIPGLEEGIKSLKVKDKKEIKVSADQAYGLRDDKYVFDVPLEKLPGKAAKVGDHFQVGEKDDGFPAKVTAVTATHATLDANHPLAGVDLIFNVEIVEVREATAEESSHGHVHGQGGHKH